MANNDNITNVQGDTNVVLKVHKILKCSRCGLPLVWQHDRWCCRDNCEHSTTYEKAETSIFAHDTYRPFSMLAKDKELLAPVQDRVHKIFAKGLKYAILNSPWIVRTSSPRSHSLKHGIEVLSKRSRAEPRLLESMCAGVDTEDLNYWIRILYYAGVYVKDIALDVVEKEPQLFGVNLDIGNTYDEPDTK